MKTFLIIIGCIFLYIFGVFITFVLFLYCERCDFGPSMAYDDNDNVIVASVLWPITIWLALGYLSYLKFKKYAIAITEVLYHINHKENKDKSNAEFHCGVEESGGHAYNCNDCPNKCDEWYQWDKEVRKKGEPNEK